MQIIRLWLLCLVALPLLAACQSGENGVQITTAAFTVENAALDLSGPQPVVIIQGQIPDTCTAVQPPTETLTGETLVLAIQPPLPFIKILIKKPIFITLCRVY